VPGRTFTLAETPGCRTALGRLRPFAGSPMMGRKGIALLGTILGMAPMAFAADVPLGAPVNVVATTGTAVPGTNLGTIIIDETADEHGAATIPNTATVNGVVYSFGYLKGGGSVTVQGNGESASDVLRFPEDVNQVLVSSDAGTDQGETNNPESYTAQNPNSLYVLIYEIHSPAEMPEPASLLLLATGALGLIGWRSCRRGHRRVSA
jgi:hypothetical protein